MLTSELDYNLPERLIATDAAELRDAAKLMVVRRDSAGAPRAPGAMAGLPSRATEGLPSRANDEALSIEHRCVRDLAEGIGETARVLQPGDLLVFNQSRVLPAFLEGVRAGTGGRVTGLFLEAVTKKDALHWRVMLESRGKLQPGEVVTLDDAASLELVEREGGGQWLARLQADGDSLAVLGRVGQTPLPPYIQAARRRTQQAERRPEDLDRYNTVFAADPGSVAAPTAGLHFTDELLKKLEAAGVNRAFVTLHVGLGTFAPVRAERVEDHDIHSEWISVPAQTIAAIKATREAGGRVIPVGTTTVRALESLPSDWESDKHADGFSTDTSLYITPPDDVAKGYPFRFTDALMTNFHLPRSTLLALVAALPGVGLEQLKGCYGEAIANDYRFYSYGDAMMIV